MISVPMSSEKLQGALVDLVTVNGRPLAMVEDSGFRKILDPIVRALQSRDPNFTANRKNLRKWVMEEAKRIREVIRKETKGIMICLKLDTASRLERSIMGLCIQFYKDGKLQIRSLCLKQLYTRHTAAHLKKEVTEVLAGYGIKLDQVYSGTTDNAANMVKLIKDLKEAPSAPEGNEHQDEDSEEEPDLGSGAEETDEGEKSDEEDCEDDPVNDAESITSTGRSEEGDGDSDGNATAEREENAMGSTDREYFQWPGEVDELLSCLEEHGVEGVRCAAHTVQLSILDALKSSRGNRRVLKKARRLCKCLRKQIIRDVLRALGLQLPGLDIVTRWGSTLKMLLDLLLIKKKAEETMKLCKVSLTDKEWKEVEDMTHCLQPAHIATKILQEEQLTVGEFLGAWLRCKLDTAAIDHPLARAITRSMERREKILLQSNAIVGAVYLDPRYQVLLSNEAKKRARSHLEALHKRLQTVSGNGTSDEGESEVHVIEEDGGGEKEDNPVEVFLKQADKEKRRRSEPKKTSIKTILQNYDGVPRLPSKANIFHYWEDNKKVHPELYNLATVTLSVPMTQVTVERSFSHLNFVLSVLRSKLDPDFVDDILCVRLNKMFMAKA